jgi:prevent-host-death family protein
MERIGVRELRQHASRYLARVRAGETIEVTDRGTPVARLVPVGREETWQDLIDAGVIIPKENPNLRLEDIEPGPAITDGPTLSEVLQQMRDEERY